MYCNIFHRFRGKRKVIFFKGGKHKVYIVQNAPFKQKKCGVFLPIDSGDTASWRSCQETFFDVCEKITVPKVWKVKERQLYIFIYFFSTPEANNGGPVSPLLGFYSICDYAHPRPALEWSPIQVLTVAQGA